MHFNSTLLQLQRIVEFVITCCGKLAGFIQGCKLRGEDRGFSPATFIGKKRKIETKEFPSCTIPLLITAFTRKLDILPTAPLYALKSLTLSKGPNRVIQSRNPDQKSSAIL